MSLIGDDSDGTTLQVLRHAGVQYPLDLLACNDHDFENMKAQINNKGFDFIKEIKV